MICVLLRPFCGRHQDWWEHDDSPEAYEEQREQEVEKIEKKEKEDEENVGERRIT